MTQRKKLAILVAGGPAPGINSVVNAATQRSAHTIVFSFCMSLSA